MNLEIIRNYCDFLWISTVVICAKFSKPNNMIHGKNSESALFPIKVKQNQIDDAIIAFISSINSAWSLTDTKSDTSYKIAPFTELKNVILNLMACKSIIRLVIDVQNEIE